MNTQHPVVSSWSEIIARQLLIGPQYLTSSRWYQTSELKRRHTETNIIERVIVVLMVENCNKGHTIRISLYSWQYEALRPKFVTRISTLNFTLLFLYSDCTCLRVSGYAVCSKNWTLEIMKITNRWINVLLQNRDQRIVLDI